MNLLEAIKQNKVQEVFNILNNQSETPVKEHFLEAMSGNKDDGIGYALVMTGMELDEECIASAIKSDNFTGARAIATMRDRQNVVFSSQHLIDSYKCDYMSIPIYIAQATTNVETQHLELLLKADMKLETRQQLLKHLLSKYVDNIEISAKETADFFSKIDLKSVEFKFCDAEVLEIIKSRVKNYFEISKNAFIASLSKISGTGFFSNLPNEIIYEIVNLTNDTKVLKDKKKIVKLTDEAFDYAVEHLKLDNENLIESSDIITNNTNSI